jgi:hypothetical protein
VQAHVRRRLFFFLLPQLLYPKALRSLWDLHVVVARFFVHFSSFCDILRSAMSDNKSFQESLDLAVDALTKAIDNREDLERRLDEEAARIENLRDAVRGLSGLCGVDYEVEYAHLLPINSDLAKGLTETIFQIFENHPDKYFSATDMRDYLRDKGFMVEKYSNFLATVHTVFKRLHKAEKIDKELKDGKNLYTYRFPF